jgi:hypothetical protein
MSMRKSRKMRRMGGMSKRRTMRRSRMMRMRGGDIANQGTISGTSAGDPAATDVSNSLISGEGAPVGGPVVPEFDPNMSTMSGGRRRRRRSMKMRGGDEMSAALPSVGSQRQMYTMQGGKRRKSRRGGSLVATAAVPFGLWGLQRYFSKSRSEGSSQRRRRGRRS